MPKPSIENIVVNSKTPAPAPADGFEWDVSFTCITSRGTRFNERKYFGPSLKKGGVWDAMRAIANDHEADENTPPVKQPADFAGRLDATAGSPTPLAPADYPVGEAPVV